jgi:5-methylcytosine-specific restriction endonuclease McrA
MRAVWLRDGGRCRTGHLEIHHLVLRCRGGTDEISNLVLVCVRHHHLLEPHGTYRLEGNPNVPGGLRLERIRAPSSA